MDFETFIEPLFAFLSQSENLYLVLYAVATCLLTQLIKKLFINKNKVEVLHKFNFAEILPFLFGVVFAVVDLLCVKHQAFGWAFVAQLLVTALTVGALAMVMFKFASSITGNSLKSLMKDDAFCVFYTQLLYLGEVRQKLSNNTLSLKEFVAQTKALAVGAKEIYLANSTEEEKKRQLHALLAAKIGANVADGCSEFLHRQLFAALCAPSPKTEK